MALLTGSISLCNFILFWGKRFGKASCRLQLFDFPDLLEHLTNTHYIQNINTKVLVLTCWVGIVDCWKRKQKNKSEQLILPQIANYNQSLKIKQTHQERSQMHKSPSSIPV